MNRPTSSSGFWSPTARSAGRRGPAARGQPLERQRQVGAALGRGDRVDLVDDAPLGAGEQLLGAAGQHQVQRLGRGDQDVGRLAQHRLALALRRVAGADGDLEVGADARAAARAGCGRCRRRAPSAARRRRARCAARRPSRLAAAEPVDRLQERGERLARSGRGRDQDVLARGDRRPGLRLGRRRARRRPCRTTRAWWG